MSNHFFSGTTQAVGPFFSSFRQNIDLILMLVRRDLKVKYRNSFLGYLWSMLNPLLFMMTISFVFSFLVRDIPNYPLFVLTGILYWNLASTSISVSAVSLVNGAGLIKKVKMSAWILPVAPVITFATNFMLAIVPYAIIYILSPSHPAAAPQIWLFPLVFVLYLLFLIGLTLVIATANVFFRDVGHVIEPVLGILMYATPIIYDRRNPALPEYIRNVLSWNPFTHFVEAGRAAVYGGEPMTWQSLAILLFCTSLSLAVGITVYVKNKRKIIFSI